MYSCRTVNNFLLPVVFVLVWLLATLLEQTSLASLKFWDLKWYSLLFTKLRQRSPPPGSPAEVNWSPPSGSPAEVNWSPPSGSPAEVILSPPSGSPAEVIRSPPLGSPAEVNWSPLSGSPVEVILSPPPGSPAEVNLSPRKGVNISVLFGNETSELTQICAFNTSAILKVDVICLAILIKLDPSIYQRIKKAILGNIWYIREYAAFKLRFIISKSCIMKKLLSCRTNQPAYEHSKCKGILTVLIIAHNQDGIAVLQIQYVMSDGKRLPKNIATYVSVKAEYRNQVNGHDEYSYIHRFVTVLLCNMMMMMMMRKSVVLVVQVKLGVMKFYVFVILRNSIEYDLCSMTLLLVSFKCIGDWLHYTIYYQSSYLYAYYLVYTAILNDDLAWFYSVYQVNAIAVNFMNSFFFCFDFVFLYDRKLSASLVMVVCRWLLSVDTERKYVVFYCSVCHGKKYCFTLRTLINLQVGTILILKFLNLVFEYG